MCAMGQLGRAPIRDHSSWYYRINWRTTPLAMTPICAAGRFARATSRPRRNNLAAAIASGGRLAFAALVLLVLLGLIQIVQQLFLGLFLVGADGVGEAASRQGGQQLLHLLEG